MALDYKIYHKSVDPTFFEDFIGILTVSPSTTFNDVFGHIDEKEPGFNVIIPYNGVQMKSSNQPLSNLYPDRLIYMLITPKSKDTAYILYQINSEGTVLGMSLLSVDKNAIIEQLIKTFIGSQIYNSDGQSIPSTSSGLLSTYFPNNKIFIYLPSDAPPIQTGTPVIPLSLNLNHPSTNSSDNLPDNLPVSNTPIIGSVDTDDEAFEQIFEPIPASIPNIVVQEPLPTSNQLILQRTLSPTQSRMRPRSPYRERANSPFKAERGELLHLIDPRKLSYERSTIYNDVYSTNDLIFLLVERGIEPPRSKIEMVDILNNFI